MFLLAETPAKNFYIDSANGNDSNSGLTTNSAWKTISKLNENAFLLTAGDSVLFKRDCVWIGERIYIEDISGSSSSPIVFGAYGAGAAPVITSVTEHTHSWIKDFGNLWKSTNPPDENPGRLWKDGKEILRANKINELGKIFRWFYDNANSEFYVYSEEDPSDAVFEYCVDFPLIIGNANFVTIENLDLQGGWTAVYIIASQHLTFENMAIGKFSENGITLDAANETQAENIRIIDSRFDSDFTLDYSTAPYYRGTDDRGASDGILVHSLVDGEISGCYFKNWGHASINLDGSIATVSSNKIFDNYLTSPDIPYGGRIGVDGESFGNEIYNNQIMNTSVQSQLDGRDNHYHHNIFYGTTSPPFNPPDFIEAGLSVEAYDDIEVTGNIYENNLMMNCDGPGIEISGNNERDIHDNVFRNNVVYNCGIKQNNVGLEIETNEYAETYGNYFQNNLIYSSSSETVISFRGSAMNVEQFNSATGSDDYVFENNVGGNPLFISVPELDFHLQSGSPCIDAGIETLAQFDFEGNPIPIGNAPDIGIYEYPNPDGANDDAENPFEFKLLQNYPNPFNPTTKIKYKISETNFVTLKIYDALGREVATLVNAKQTAGKYETKFDARGFSSGIYIYRIDAGKFTSSKKMLLLK